MRRTTRRRSKAARRAIVATAALALGAGGLVTVNMYASADAGDSQHSDTRGRALSARGSTIDCPDVGQRLSAVPQRARA